MGLSENWVPKDNHLPHSFESVGSLGVEPTVQRPIPLRITHLHPPAVSASATFQLRRCRTAAVLPESGDRPCEEENADPGVVARQDCLVGREHHCAKGLLG